MADTPASESPSPDWASLPPAGAPDTPSPLGTPAPAGSDSAHPILLLAGQRPLPEYELFRRLGKGGFGEVWQAHGPGAIAVALKFIALEEAAGRVELRSLELMKDVRHPHLLPVFGVWQRETFLILAMELADKTLQDRLDEVRRPDQSGIPLPELLDHLRDAARGIDHLNSLNIQHRDIKPQNLLLVGGGVKVADFGLARLLEHSIATHSGAMTPAFAAPEFIQGKVANQSDQYCLAATYYRLRTGQLLFEGNHVQVMAGHMTQPPDLSKLTEAERPALARALAKEPQQRWPNCRAFAEALTAASAGRSPVAVATPLPPSPRSDSETPTLRQRGPEGARAVLVPAAVAALLALVAVVLVGWIVWRGWRAPKTPTQMVSKKDSVPPPKAPEPGEPKEIAVDLGGGVKMEFVRIPAGKFLMGSPEDEKDRSNDEKQHEVEIAHAFYLGKYAVTQEQYEKVMGANPSYFSPQGGGKEKVQGLDTRRFPVENVSWENAVEFCKTLSELHEKTGSGRVYRLPTEAEWEYACRGGFSESGPFFFAKPSATLSSDQANFDGNAPYGGAPKGPCLARTTQVGSYPG